MKYDVFISYSSKDQKVAEGICGYLESYKLRCFVAYRDIPKGKVWAAEIVKGLDESQMMVIVFSENFNCSEQVDREIELAAEDKKPILTFRIADDQFKGAKKYYLKNLNWIDAFPNPEASFSALYSDVCKLLGKPVLNKEILHASEKNSTTESQLDKKQGANLSFNVNGVSFDMVYVEKGSFMMGATSEQGGDAFDNEKPAHKVTLSDYYIGMYEVTQELWKAVMGNNPSDFEGRTKPVDSVSRDDCQNFIRKLNSLCLSQLGGKRFALPTEAQWEFAARGGNKSQGYKYAGSNNLPSVAWYEDNSDGSTHAVGTKSPNELGLYDMSGNVWEWCQDWYGSYSSSSQSNPASPANGSYRVYRGGSWGSDARDCRVSNRGRSTPSNRFNFLGFRLVCLP